MACYVPIKKRKDSKVTMRLLALSNNFTTDRNHLEIQAHDSRGDKMWKIYFNPCKHHFISVEHKVISPLACYLNEFK